MRRIVILSLAACSLCILWASPSEATPEYSEKTGAACSMCHTNPEGGGDLTASGEYYSAFGRLPADSVPAASNPGQAVPEKRFVPILSLGHNARLITGYIHILVAFMWFGTIFYIHIIIGPEKLSSGVPKAERRLGLASMLTVAVTGSMLTLSKIDSFSGFANTLFGRVLEIKVTLFLLMVILGSIAVTILTRGIKRAGSHRKHAASESLDANTLADYDGQGDRPAYVAVAGAVYDVSSSEKWSGGVHLKRHRAGRDLTSDIEKAPHGTDVLDKFKQVGRLESSSASTPSVSRKYFLVFKIFAYVNLMLALGILLCIAFWRWGFPAMPK